MDPSSKKTRRRSLSLITASAGVIALLAFFSAGASAAVGHWYVNGAPAGETPVAVSGSNAGAFHFGWVIGGVQLDAECSSATAGGSITNPAGGGAGSLTSGSLVLSGCVVKIPAGQGCQVGTVTNGTVEKGLIRFRPLRGTATDKSVSYLPESTEPGSVYLLLSVSGCAKGPYNGQYEIKGSMSAVASTSNPGTYEFTLGSSSLTFGGQKAYMTGKYNLATASGGVVTVGP